MYTNCLPRAMAGGPFAAITVTGGEKSGLGGCPTERNFAVLSQSLWFFCSDCPIERRKFSVGQTSSGSCIGVAGGKSQISGMWGQKISEGLHCFQCAVQRQAPKVRITVNHQVADHRRVAAIGQKPDSSGLQVGNDPMIRAPAVDEDFDVVGSHAHGNAIKFVFPPFHFQIPLHRF